MILSLDVIFNILKHYDILLIRDSLSNFELSILFGLGNLTWFVLLFFLFYILYKILSRIVNSLF